ncbi:MAG TPA: hypothetical protein VF765_16170 [Polyangiaceae bacterium]
MNTELADAFAQACRAMGARADATILGMARLSPDRAPGATALEFLPVCGVYAVAARAAASDAKGRAALVAELHARADDLRFRVRDAVIEGLARVGASAGDALVTEVGGWMDGYFHAAAVVRALAHEAWLSRLQDAQGVLDRLDEAFVLVRDAPRAAARWPGHKALVEALGDAPGRVAVRFGVPVFDLFVRWTAVQDPALRDALEQTLKYKSLAGRFAPEVERVRDALQASLPPARNPDHDVGPTRNRSKSRKRKYR